MLALRGRPRPDAPTVTADLDRVLVRVESELDPAFWLELVLTATDLRGLLASLPDAPADPAPPDYDHVPAWLRVYSAAAGRCAAWTATMAPAELAGHLRELSGGLSSLAGQAEGQTAGLRTTIARLRAFLQPTVSDG